MSWDFCSPHLKPRIHCDKVSVDGHEITNLISDDYFIKTRGFMAERFIKTPVLITLSFPCNVDISKVIINPIVGSQKSCGLEIMTRSDPLKDSWITNDSFLQEKAPHTQGVYVPIGRCLHDISGPNLFVFTNRTYRQRSNMPQNGAQDPSSSHSGVIHAELRHFRNSSLSNVSHLLIRITRTMGACIPCIKSLSVLGQPSYSVPKNILAKLCSLDKQFWQKHHQDCELVSNRGSPKLEDKASNPLPSAEGESDIPKDFVDPITCDVMAVPLLLPSGHSVDKSTIERHVVEEAKWGRAPNDPFTGVAFHGNNKPIPNSALKARIDQFMVKNGMKFKAVRTVGKSGDLCNQGIPLNSVYSASKKDINFDDMLIKSIPPGRKSISTEGGKEIEDPGNHYSTKRKNVNEHIDLESKKMKYYISGKTTPMAHELGKKASHSPKIACHMFPFSTTTISKSVHAKTHDKNISTSLNAAMTKALAHLPSFIPVKPQISGEAFTVPESEICAGCTLDLKSSDVGTYVLPCAHYLCRQCLVDKGKGSVRVTCGKCHLSWPSKDVRKTYVS